MIPAPRPTFELLESVSLWGRTLKRHEVPFVYPGGHRLPLYRQQGMVRAFDIRKDAERLLRNRSELLESVGFELTSEAVAETEERLVHADSQYRPGQYLSLLRLAFDIKETQRSGLTVIERRTFHLARRRLLQQQASERPAHPEQVAAFLTLLGVQELPQLQGLADAFRMVEEASRHPLVGWPHLAGMRQLQLVLASVHLMSRVREELPASAAFLGARAVLAQRNLHFLRSSSLLDTSFDSGHPAWSDLVDWLVELPETLPTFSLPEELSSSLFVARDRSRDCLELVDGAVKRILQGRQAAGPILEAVERTFYRRVYKQEGAKHLQAASFERDFDTSLSTWLRKAMRAPKMGTSTAIGVESIHDAGLEPVFERAQALERCKVGGWTPSVSRTVTRLLSVIREEDAAQALLPRLFEQDSVFLAGSDEFLRLALDCRGDLVEAVEAISPEEKAKLAHWTVALWREVAELEQHEAPLRQELSRRVRRLVGAVVPLEWACAACMAPEPMIRIPWQLETPDDWISQRREWVQKRIGKWRVRLPWEIGLQGIWPAPLRGELFGPGLEDGLYQALKLGRDARKLEIQAKARMDLLEAEMGFCAWLGARERYELFRAAFQPHQGKAFGDDVESFADVEA